MEMKVEILSKTSIKPSSPTPQHLKTFKFSIFDQLNPSVYVPLLLYYSDQSKLDPVEKSQKLKWSLSQVLTHFYPFAGRIKDNFTIQCTDEGVEFIETQVDCNLSDILKFPDPVLFEKLLPKDVLSIKARTGCLLVVQANFFKEDGLVISVSLSHKIADGSTLSSFINAWAGLAAESPEVKLPVFGASTKFPPVDYLATLPTTIPTLDSSESNRVVTRRYVINAAKIAALKSQAASESVPNPTSVEAVSALIWKCITKASRKNHDLPKVKASVLGQAVNLRKRVDPPLSDSDVGNLAAFFPARIEEDELELGLQTLVTRLRKGKDSMVQYIEQLTGENGAKATFALVGNCGELMMNESIEFYKFTSLCRFPFYEADFGWGRPKWLSLVSFVNGNFIRLIDAPGGDGIEAWVALDGPTMTIFERDEELLQFAVFNPSVSL